MLPKWKCCQFQCSIGIGYWLLATFPQFHIKQAHTPKKSHREQVILRGESPREEGGIAKNLLRGVSPRNLALYNLPRFSFPVPHPSIPLAYKFFWKQPEQLFLTPRTGS